MMYEELAGHYDELVGDAEAFDAWTDWINQYIPQGSILDCACGSGEIASRLDRTHNVTGMDLSEQMVARAWQKFPGICWKQGDMTDLADYGRYDAITCLCDSINYLVNRESLEAFFQEAWSHADWLLFDMHSLDRKEEFAQGWMETGTFEDGTQVQWDIQSEEDLLYQEFTFWKPNGEIFREHHVQRIWDPQEVTDLLKKTGFEIVDVTTDFNFPGICEGEKYFFVCRRIA